MIGETAGVVGAGAPRVMPPDRQAPGPPLPPGRLDCGALTD